MQDRLIAAIEEVTGGRVVDTAAMGGGCVGKVYEVALGDGERLVAKFAAGDLKVEAAMLEYLARHSRLPVPEVIHADDAMLLMTLVPTAGGLDQKAQIHAADLVADLHGISADRFGFDHDTPIGGLLQPNPRTASWLEFFARHRLIEMAGQAVAAGRLPGEMAKRVEDFAGRLDRWLSEPARPSLIHGDMWGGNVLCANGRISGFIDPAIYFADPEIELAFTTLFATFGDAFFSRYGEQRPIEPGFFEQRRDIYNLYPLLVHVRLFGGSYVGSVDGILRKFGF